MKVQFAQGTVEFFIVTCNPGGYKWSHLHQMKALPLSFMGRYGLEGQLDFQTLREAL